MPSQLSTSQSPDWQVSSGHSGETGIQEAVHINLSK